MTTTLPKNEERLALGHSDPIDEEGARRIVADGRDAVIKALLEGVAAWTGAPWVIEEADPAFRRSWIWLRPESTSTRRQLLAAVGLKGTSYWGINDTPEGWARGLLQTAGVQLLPVLDPWWCHASPEDGAPETACQRAGLVARWITGRPAGLVVIRTRVRDDVTCPACLATRPA